MFSMIFGVASSGFAQTKFCHKIKKIMSVTKYENHKVYVDKDGRYHFPKRLPHQLKTISSNSKVMKDMCSLDPTPCGSDSLGPTKEFLGFENLLALQPKVGAEMLGEDRGQVYFWSNKYSLKYCK